VDKPFEAWIAFKKFPAFISKLAAKDCISMKNQAAHATQGSDTLFGDTYGEPERI
jgi:hypothetical protein